MEENEGGRKFEFSFSPGSGKNSMKLTVPVNILEMKSKDVPELCARVMNYHNIPCFVEADMVSTLESYIDKEFTDLKNRKSAECVRFIRQNAEAIKNIADVVAEKYGKTWLKYAQPVSGKANEFPLAYHYLIHSAAMQTLLKLESKYHSALTKIILNKEQSITKMQERHQLEMARVCEHVGFAYTNEDVTALASKHLADTERLQAHWENQYVTMTESQKKEFRQVLMDFCTEMKENNDTVNDSGPAYNRIKQIIDETVTVVTPQHLHNGVHQNDVDSRLSSPQVSSHNGSSAVLMEESFTINLGAQLKTMHNIRLVVTDLLNFCRYSDDGEMDAQRFQTAMSLYSNSLSAIVLFADARLGYKIGIQKEFHSICHSSTDFHFDSLSQQLAGIQKHASSCRTNNSSSESTENDEEGYLHLNEGDFYITKHSNLSQVHVVFHLVTDENNLQTKASLANVTSRHPVITSIRQILKVASSHDIGTITLPLLLTHELTEEITFQWCVKRAELVMKCVKGFMMEMATWDGGISRTIQFVIPPGVSEEVFDRLRTTLPEVFRTTSTLDLSRKKLSTR